MDAALRIFWSLAAAAAGLYVFVALTLFLFQRKLLYAPDAQRIAPAAIGLRGVEDVELSTPDGETLIAWFAPPAAGSPTLLYFHGNGGGLSNRRERIERLTRAGFGIFMPSYRGYSGSSGRPSERAIIADAGLAYDALRARGVEPRDIVLYGESLGSGVAVQIAAARKARALVLDAPYTSMADAARVHYPWLPVSLFLLDRYDSASHIVKVKAPILILHGARDETIPLRLAEALYALAGQPKVMAVFAQGAHSDLYNHGALERLRAFLDDYPSDDR